MFVKRVVKPTLIENYDEAIRVEDDHDSIEKHTLKLEVKPVVGKKPLLLTIPK